MPKDVALRHLTYIAQDGERHQVTLRIGVPHAIAEGEWACPVAIDGLFSEINEIRGIDSWQALTGGIAFLAQLLRGILNNRGGTLRYIDDDDSEVNITSLFAGGA